MKYEFKAKRIDVTSGGKNIAVLNVKDAKQIATTALDRLTLSLNGKQVSALVDLAEACVRPGEIGLFAETAKALDAKSGSKIYAQHAEKPASIEYIKKKMDGFSLQPAEIDTIIQDVMADNLSDIEAMAFMISTYIRGMNYDEIVALTNSIIRSGAVLEFKRRPIMDKHCLGGVPGNRTTLLIVPIVAAAGLLIPKTSSKSISSPAGTADTMAVLAPVTLTEKEIISVVNKCNGCIVWGGGMNLAAADDKLIRLRHPLSLDPQGVMLASILAKKKAVGATHVLIDLPMGKGCKVANKHDADSMAADFMNLGTKLGMEVECIVTPGYDPIGFAVGPALEARETLRILGGDKVSPELIEKSLVMAGIILEMGGACPKGKGRLMAESILNSGKAAAKMREIIELQGGNPKAKWQDIPIGKYKIDIEAREPGRIHFISVRQIATIARAAGAPNNPGAGIYLYVEKGDKIKKGQKLFTVYAESENKLDAAMEAFEKEYPIELEKIILDKYTSNGEDKPRVHEFGAV